MSAVAIVTGAAGGIGSAIGQKLASRDIRLVLVDLDVDALERTRATLDMGEADCLIVPADVAQEEDVRRYVDLALATFGRIDYFANNAGIEGPSALLEDLSPGELDRIYEVNVRGVFLGLHFVLPPMKKQKTGAIVNTASLASLWGLPKLGAYIMSKHAVAGLTKVAAVEAAADGVRVNAVLPGNINTPMMRRIEQGSGHAEESRRAFAKAAPMERYGEPEEVANLVSFLLSDEASFITASLYTIDGGTIWQ